MLDRFKGALKSDTNLGLATRVGLFLLLMGVLFALACEANAWLERFENAGISPPEMFVVFVVAVFPMGASLVLAELPRGQDWMMVRFGLATFCRTGLPLFCLVAITLTSEKQLQPALIGYLVLFYIAGFILVVLLSVSRLAGHSGTTDNDEVNRAPVA